MAVLSSASIKYYFPAQAVLKSGLFTGAACAGKLNITRLAVCVQPLKRFSTSAVPLFRSTQYPQYAVRCGAVRSERNPVLRVLRLNILVYYK